MTAEELRDILKTLLAEDLGVYSLESGDFPAIAVRHSGDVADKQEVSGLEVIVRVEADSNPRYLYGGLQRRRTWQVFLIQRSGPSKLKSAIDKIESRFAGARSVPIKTEKNVEIRAQVSVRIPDQQEYAEFSG